MERRENHSTFVLHFRKGRWLRACIPFEKLRAGLPGIVGNLELDNVGHWVQHEASAQVSEQLVKFLRTVSPV